MAPIEYQGIKEADKTNEAPLTEQRIDTKPGYALSKSNITPISKQNQTPGLPLGFHTEYI